jgi:hypothetical protein
MAKTPPLYYFTVAMSGLYIVLGLFIMLSPNMQTLLPGWKQYAIGALFIVYAFFRFRRLKKLKESMEAKLDDKHSDSN